MSIPGFTADISLERFGGQYYVIGYHNSSARGTKVVAQNCAIGVFTACHGLLMHCWFTCGWWSRFFGSGPCRTCMSACMATSTWPAGPGPCAACVTTVGSGVDMCV